jgi:hypothetical protein
MTQGIGRGASGLFAARAALVLATLVRRPPGRLRVGGGPALPGRQIAAGITQADPKRMLVDCWISRTRSVGKMGKVTGFWSLSARPA